MSSSRDPNPAAAEGIRAGSEVTCADGRSLPLLGAKLRGDAKGGLARLVLEQTFENRYAESLNVTYRMPLPADGAVSAYAFEIAGRTIVGRVDKRAAAREQFEQAVAEGKTAALLEQDRGDIFTQQLGNVPAHERLVARITVDVRLAWLPEGEWELRFPTVIGPRYIGIDDTAADARATAVETVQDVAARISIEVKIADSLVVGRTPSSPNYRVSMGEGGVVSLAVPGGAALDRDIVLRWPVAKREVGLGLDVTRLASGEAYGLLTVVPPAPDAGASVLPRDLILLLDTSGSMSGAPLDKAKHVAAMLIDSLGEADRLEMIEFSMAARRWRAEPVAGTPEHKRAAIAWVRGLDADGGTEMGTGVREALRALRPGAQRQVVLVTDGYVGGEQQLVRLLLEKLPASCRLHAVGIGAAVNRSLLGAMARAGRGAEVLVDLDEDIERGTRRLVDRTRAPVLTNLELSGTALVRHVPEHLPDVFAGAPLVAAVELSPEGGELELRGDLAGGRWVQRVTVPARRAGEGNAAVAQLYAREHVADLETRWTIGDQHALDREIEDTGVRFQIATRLTSWVAIDHDRRVDVATRDERVPQMLPYGTTAASFGLRAPAPSTMLGMAAGMASVEKMTMSAPALATYSAMPPSPPSSAYMRLEDAPPPPARARAPRAPRRARLVARAVNDLDLHLAAIMAGDLDAFARWLAGAEGRVRDSLRSFATVVDVEAVLQEALVRVWQVAPRFERDGRPDGLVRLAVRIARNLAVSELRRQRRGEVFDEATAEPTSSVAPDPLLRTAILECRDKLPPKPRQALDARLAAEGGRDDEALAEALGMRLNTFLQNFTRARQLLAECLGKRGITIEVVA